MLAESRLCFERGIILGWAACLLTVGIPLFIAVGIWLREVYKHKFTKDK